MRKCPRVSGSLCSVSLCLFCRLWLGSLRDSKCCPSRIYCRPFPISDDEVSGHYAGLCSTTLMCSFMCHWLIRSRVNKLHECDFPKCQCASLDGRIRVSARLPGRPAWKQVPSLSPPTSRPFCHFHLIFEHEDLRIQRYHIWSQFERGGGGGGGAFRAEREVEECVESHQSLQPRG